MRSTPLPPPTLITPLEDATTPGAADKKRNRFSFALSQCLQLLPRRLQPQLLIFTLGISPVSVQPQKAEVVPLLLVDAHFKIQSVFWRLHATLAFAQSWVVLFLNIWRFNNHLWTSYHASLLPGMYYILLWYERFYPDFMVAMDNLSALNFIFLLLTDLLIFWYFWANAVENLLLVYFTVFPKLRLMHWLSY